jgi:3-methyladenine DNA glycosylase Mpg
MFDFFKSKHRRTVERAANELTQGFGKICEALNVQMDLLIFFEGRKKVTS